MYFAHRMKSDWSIQTVRSLDLPALQPYKTLRRPMEHMKEGIFVAEGEKVVRRLLESDLSLLSMLMTQRWYEEISSAASSRPGERCTVYIAEQRLLETIVGYNLHQGIMAVGKVPTQQSLERILASASKPLLLVALDSLVNAENVGVVVRNCAAFGVGAIIVGETSSSPYLRRAVRNSMGTVFQLPIVHVDDLAATLRSLAQQHRVAIVAAHPRGESAIREIPFASDACIVFGNEGEGISADVLKVCTQHAAIPMMNGTDSLNVASASAVVLYEAMCQRSGE